MISGTRVRLGKGSASKEARHHASLVGERPPRYNLFDPESLPEALKRFAPEVFASSEALGNFFGFQDDNAQVRYHAFNESEDSDTKLVDWVAVRRLRPLPAPPPPSFSRGLRAGTMVEMLYEDGWWVD